MAVIYEKRGRIAIVTIDRPQARNSLDFETMGQLANAWLDFRDDPDLWVAILTGSGERDFCVGADLKTFIPAVTDNIEALASGEKSLLGDQYPPNAPLVAVLREGDIWKPIIAAVNGICSSGGLEMLQGTDIRIAAEHATFSIAEPKRGLFPGGGTTVRLPRQIPFVWAMEILLTCEFISAQKAYEIGLINRVVPKEELMPTALRIAEKICENAPLAIQAVKRSVRKCMNLPMDEALNLELEIAAEVFMTEDAREGPLAFMEKRKPVWKGK
jgi:enoyl-CoA hydratase